MNRSKYFFLISRAIFVRILFACHGAACIFRLYWISQLEQFWWLSLSLIGLFCESFYTIYWRNGNEYKWLCPSVFFYLISTVPAIWFLELYELEKRISFKSQVNISYQSTVNVNSSGSKDNVKQLSINSEEWMVALEQILLLCLIIGRWILPKGKLTRDQLSQMLLVYIGTAADIVEFFDVFKEETVRYNKQLCCIILAIWSWSLTQFVIILMAVSENVYDNGGIIVIINNGNSQSPDVKTIIISIITQDMPFLIFRLLLILQYNVRSYSNYFFTCKNTLIILLLIYRLIVIKYYQRQTNLQNRSRLTAVHTTLPINNDISSSTSYTLLPPIKAKTYISTCKH